MGEREMRESKRGGKGEGRKIEREGREGGRDEEE